MLIAYFILNLLWNIGRIQKCYRKLMTSTAEGLALPYSEDLSKSFKESEFNRLDYIIQPPGSSQG